MIARLRRLFPLLPAGIIAGVAAALAVLFLTATTPAAVSAQAVAKSYTAEQGTQAGMVVQINDDELRVSPAVQNKLDAILGVVVLPNDAPLSLTETASERQVYVSTSGTYTVLVSDQNGPINKDDYIAVSSLAGIGMRANAEPNVIIGKAMTGFDGRTNIKTQTKVKDSAGNDRTIRFGYVTANINVTRNPLYRENTADAPGFIQRFAEGVADKPVSTVKAYICAAILAVTTIIVAVVLSTGIRASVTALGRNPLARKNILRNLLQVVLIGMTIFIVGLIAVYLLLKL